MAQQELKITTHRAPGPPMPKRPAHTTLPATAAAQTYKQLAMSLQFDLQFADESRLLMLTTPLHEQDRLNSTLGLSHYLAVSERRRVLLIDAAFQSRALTSHFRCRGAPGFLDCLDADKAYSLETLSRTTTQQNIRFLPAGAQTSGMAASLKQQRLREFLGHVRTQFDDVLLHTEPVLRDPLSLAFPSLLDAVLLFVAEGQTSLDHLDFALKALSASGARRTGIVMTTRSAKLGTSWPGTA